jgi:hypothetical protein
MNAWPRLTPELTPGLAACLLAFATVLLSQTPNVTLTGKVSYPDGSPVSKAPIQLKNTTTGVDARTVTTPDGRYQFAGLAPGVWEYSIVMPCCAWGRVHQTVSLKAGTPVQVNVSLIETINGSTLGDDPARLADVLRKRARVPAAPAPRTAAGKPDLSGVWLITDDPYPEDPDLVPWAADVVKQRQETFGKDAPHNRCLPGPPPASGSAAPFLVKFVQTSSLIVMLIEDNPGFRQVFLDGRTHPALWNPTWLGHSVGKWERDTLVVDTTGFNDRSWLGGIGGGLLPHTEMLHMTERYHRSDIGHMTGEIIFDDPGAYRKAVRENLTFDLVPQEEVLEYVCENTKPQHLVGH